MARDERIIKHSVCRIPPKSPFLRRRPLLIRIIYECEPRSPGTAETIVASFDLAANISARCAKSDAPRTETRWGTFWRSS
jgi:hypothetical protein